MRRTENTCTYLKANKGLRGYTLTRFHAYTPTRLHALTLIELVIVCAIIAVLAGIVWVVMAPAREKARQTVCISNLTQIGHAFRMYRDDWDGVEPQKGMQLEYWQLGLPLIHPAETLAPYQRDKRLWLCPSRFLKPLEDPKYYDRLGYLPNYCAPFNHPNDSCQPSNYDICPLIPPGTELSFKQVVAHIPDWPIALCLYHNYFYFREDEWGDGIVFGLPLDELSPHRFWISEYALRLPSYLLYRR